jgi:DNA repair exonuclease SbcCD ATPase subunit
VEETAMADPETNVRDETDWPAQGIRQRLGSRIERHVLRSAVDMLDERGTELDTIERDLVKRETDLSERLSRVAAEEAQIDAREQRLQQIGAQDLDAAPTIDHLIRTLDETEAAAAALRAKSDGKVLAAETKAREAIERAKRLEEAEHHRVLSAADITRRESTITTRERELREQDERLREREQALGAKQHALIADEQKREERYRKLETIEQDARKRLDSVERMEQEIEEREHALRGRDQRWWGSDNAFGT